MFVNLNGRRVKISSIGEYAPKGASSSGNYYAEIKISGKHTLLFFNSMDDMNFLIDKLDKIFKVE